ncbi:MAG: hypothetical protein RIQ81_2517 [Pseudomonadota bacterium]
MNDIRAIYCIGRNYGAHARELGNALPAAPIVFLKSPAALRGLKDEGVLAYQDETFHHEAELVLRVGPGSGASPARIEAVALGLDLTRREEQNRLKKEGLPWTSAKSFKGAAVLTGFTKLPANIDAGGIKSMLDAARFTLWVNGEQRQQGCPADMMFPCSHLLAVLDASHGLREGDIIFTGTPEGVGPVRRGDKIRLQLVLEGKTAIDESGVL